MYFVISSPPDDIYSHVFAVHEGLKRIALAFDDDLCTPDNLNPSFQFPWELTEMCLLQLLETYIRCRNYSLAIQLLSINKLLLSSFYTRYFRTDSKIHTISITGIQCRLSAVFHLFYDIWEAMSEAESPHFQIGVDPYKGIDSFFPWNYDPPGNFSSLTEFYYTSFPAIVSYRKEIDYTPHSTGPRALDYVLLAGETRQGILRASWFRTPAVFLRFVTPQHEVIPRYEHMMRSHEWKTFGMLLRKGLGPYAAVLVEVRPASTLPDSVVFTEHILLEI